MSASKRLLLLSALLLNAALVFAVDLVTINVGESEYDKRIFFKNELVKLALDITEEHYGEYEIVENPQRMNISRAFQELEKGENLSLTFAHTNPKFESMALAIKVPLRRSIDSYRLLLVKKEDVPRFQNIQTIDDLRQFSIGLSPNWSTYKIMQSEGFDIVDTPNYNSMFRMLEQGRFDILPRAVNEIYYEFEDVQSRSESLAILPGVVLFIPASTYMFVSPKQPRIYKRLSSGIHALNLNGDLSKLIDKYYMEFAQRARIQDRSIITILPINSAQDLAQQVKSN